MGSNWRSRFGFQPGGPRLAVAALVGFLLIGAVFIGGVRPYLSPSAPGPADEESETLVPTLASSTGQCGIERWAVKTGTDADAHLVDLAATTTTTIADMRSFPKPASLPLNGRIQPQETTVYSIDATLTEYKLETDSDYHLVIQDAGGNTMITEIPDPACTATTSPFAGGVQNARAELTLGSLPRPRLRPQPRRFASAASGSSTSSTARPGSRPTASSCIRCSTSSSIRALHRVRPPGPGLSML